MDKIKACSNVIAIKPSLKIAETLRSIADDIENGNIETSNMTLVADCGKEIYQIGSLNDAASAKDLIFNLTTALTRASILFTHDEQ